MSTWDAMMANRRPPGDGPKVTVDGMEGNCLVAVPREVVDKLEAFVAGAGVLPEEPDPGPRTYVHTRNGAHRLRRGMGRWRPT